MAGENRIYQAGNSEPNQKHVFARNHGCNVRRQAVPQVLCMYERAVYLLENPAIDWVHHCIDLDERSRYYVGIAEDSLGHQNRTPALVEVDHVKGRWPFLVQRRVLACEGADYTDEKSHSSVFVSEAAGDFHHVVETAVAE